VKKAYDGLIAEMRMKGMTLQQIADSVGVTREWIRQILKNQHPEVKVGGHTEHEVARMLGQSPKRLAYWRGKGVLKPKRLGGRWVYDDAEVEKTKQILEELKKSTNPVTLTCRACGKEFQIKRWDYRSRLGRKNRPRRLPFFFCSRQCFGKYSGVHYGFGKEVRQKSMRKWLRLLVKYEDYLPLPSVSKRDNEVVLATISGVPTREICKKYGFTRQRIYQIERRCARVAVATAKFNRKHQGKSKV